MLTKDFIGGILFRQSNISAGNRKSLTGYLTSPDAEIRAMAQLALDIAQAKPHRRKRYRYLKARHPELLTRLHLLFPDEFYQEDPYVLETIEADEVADELPVQLWPMDLESLPY